jgi:hypothetical protein
MDNATELLISQVYDAFNARQTDEVLSKMHPDVHWPNGWEGGYVNGHQQVREYWTRQWKELNPTVKPVSIRERQDGTIEVEVHQRVKDLNDQVLFDGMIKHIYSLEKGKIKTMEIHNHPY